jgi:ABC-type iron transport system FetAB ATPase subunit
MSAPLEIRGLSARRGDQEVLRGVDLDVAPGEICALMGVSGAGKSTVLRSIAALQPFSAGHIRIGDVTLAPGALPGEARCARCDAGRGWSSAHALFEHLTVLDNPRTDARVRLAPGARRGGGARAARVAGGPERIHALPRELSGGEAQRVAIARALAPTRSSSWTNRRRSIPPGEARWVTPAHAGPLRTRAPDLHTTSTSPTSPTTWRSSRSPRGVRRRTIMLTEPQHGDAGVVERAPRSDREASVQRSRPLRRAVACSEALGEECTRPPSLTRSSGRTITRVPARRRRAARLHGPAAADRDRDSSCQSVSTR